MENDEYILDAKRMLKSFSDSDEILSRIKGDFVTIDDMECMSYNIKQNGDYFIHLVLPKISPDSYIVERKAIRNEYRVFVITHGLFRFDKYRL